MSPREFNEFVETLRDHGVKCKSRMDVEDYVWYLACACENAGKSDLAFDLKVLHDEIDSIETEDILRFRTFSRERGNIVYVS